MVDLERIQNMFQARTKQYGHPSYSFSKIAEGWSIILNTHVEPQQVALCMMWLKICRHTNKPDQDNIDDIVGYCMVHDMISEEES